MYKFMESIPLRIRFSDKNIVLDEVATLSKEGNLIYNDEGGDLKAHFKTAAKFAMLTAASPLTALARVVRSAVFACLGEFNRAGREFIGALFVPLIEAVCFTGTLLSSLVYIISSGKTSFYIPMRRTHAFFEAFVNQIDLKNPQLVSYSSRISAPTNFISRIWTTAPCIQPFLEKGYSEQGGLLDEGRIQRMFPFLQVNGVQIEKGQVVIQSQYEDVNKRYVACGGAYEHMRETRTCCCFRVEAAYDRFLCCEAAQGSCSTIANSGNSCGFASLSAFGVGVGYCYTQKDNHKLNSLSSGCFGPQGASCITHYKSA
jgi:hypothetical protein